MLWNLLSDAGQTSSGNGGSGSQSIIFFVIIIAALVLFLWWSRRSQKKREKEINDTLDAIQPGNKVKTIGGICGIVVELCPEDNTFILETGSESTGKSYIKFDKKAVYQTDATAKKEEPVAVEETPVEEAPVEETPVEEETEAPVFEEEAPVVEETAEEVTAEEATEETQE